MITVERTGGGLCGETVVKHGVKNLVFAPNANVAMTAHGILVVERGLATSKTTYQLDLATTGTMPIKRRSADTVATRQVFAVFVSRVEFNLQRRPLLVD